MEAFRQVPRKNFLKAGSTQLVDIDKPILIGHGQTNSQPSTVEAMLRWLDVKKGQKVLDVGSGSGWTAALLSNLVGPKGRVVAVDIVPELVELGKSNCKKLKLKNITFHQATNEFGWPEDAPYDRILVSASAESLPDSLIDQLANDGKMVIPVRNEIIELSRGEASEVLKTSHYGFAFVPLVARQEAAY